MWLEQSPHRFWLNALVQEVECVVQTGLGQPNLLAHPLFDLLQVDLQDLGGKIGDEVLCDVGVVDLVVLAERGRVAISE